MDRLATPLRYPGGKTKLYAYTKELIEYNNLVGCTYIEPFAGGAGLALKLLNNNVVSEIILNDINTNLYYFWNSALFSTTALINKILQANISIEEWYAQKQIFDNPSHYSEIEVGFSTLFLNRTNFSGILTAGPIGGKKQAGKYKIGCRFNKEKLIALIQAIGKNSDKIKFFNSDAINFLKDIKKLNVNHNSFTFIDPPYYIKGQDLYVNFYNHNDHENLKNQLTDLNLNWILTYDYTAEIENLYSDFNSQVYDLNYSAHARKKGTEIMIYSKNIKKINFI